MNAQLFAGIALIAGLCTAVAIVGARFIGWRAMAMVFAIAGVIVTIAGAGSFLIEAGLAK